MKGLSLDEALAIIDNCIKELHTRFLIAQKNFVIKVHMIPRLDWPAAADSSIALLTTILIFSQNSVLQSLASLFVLGAYIHMRGAMKDHAQRTRTRRSGKKKHRSTLRSRYRACRYLLEAG